MRIAPALLSVVVVLGGCKEKPKSRSESGSGSPSGSGSESGSRAPKKDPAADVNAEASAFLDRWVDTQRKLDFEAYAALYEPRTFRGIKRTSRGGAGKVTEFDFAGWKTDRARMFKNKFEIAVEPKGVETWLDSGSKLKRGMVVLRFVQRWRSDKYADHGIKALHVWRAPDGGMKITYEDLLNSEPGWERVAPDVPVADLPPPADDAAALALWHRLGVTGANYEEKLAAIPDDEAVRQPMAKVLLAGGNFDCKDLVEYDECGNEYVEWADFNVKAGFGDACLRRRLALWAIDEVKREDLPALTDALVAMAKLERPEDELPQEVALRVADAPEPVRLAVYRALVAAGREDQVSIDGLSEAGLVAAAVEHGIDVAALALHEVRHLEELTELLSSDDLTDETRTALLEKLDQVKDPKVHAALIELTSDDNCELAMDAALVLDRRKDSSRLPRRSAKQTMEEARHAICMLLHDPDESRSHARLAEFLDPAGVTVDEQVENGWEDYDQDDAGPGDDEAEEEDDEPETLTTIGEVLPHLREVLVASGSWERANLALTKGKDGGFYITSFDFYRWEGCGC
jgi:hypothetical protein